MTFVKMTAIKLQTQIELARLRISFWRGPQNDFCLWVDGEWCNSCQTESIAIEFAEKWFPDRKWEVKRFDAK